MSNNFLAVIEQRFDENSHQLKGLLSNRLPLEQLKATFLATMQQGASAGMLLQCSPASLLKAVTTAANLALPLDGTTGQAYLVPYKGQAQLIIGYKGYNTLAARAGYTIKAGVVFSNDRFSFNKGTSQLNHSWDLGCPRGDIIGAWAMAEKQGFAPAIEILDREELDGVKAKSAGARRTDSPWNDYPVGYIAMCEKTVKRRLQRSLPQSDRALRDYHLAAAMEQSFEEMPRVDAKSIQPAAVENINTLVADQEEKRIDVYFKSKNFDWETWCDLIMSRIETAEEAAQLDELRTDLVLNQLKHLRTINKSAYTTIITTMAEAKKRIGGSS